MSDISYAPEKIDPDAVPSPYPGRTEPLPWNRSEVTAEWLGRTVANKYPGVAAHSLEVIQLFDSHTTKMRVAVDWNESGKAAGLPRDLCLKSNWSGAFNDVDICALEARFYHYLARSEEHTSELQSLMRISYAVICLKKKKN